MVSWGRAIYQYHVNGTDTVGRSVDAHGPVDHASVGLAQARPNHFPVHSMDSDIAKEARVPYCSC